MTAIKPISIKDAPEAFQKYLRIGDANDGPKGYNGQVDTLEEAQKAYNVCTGTKAKNCDDLLIFLEKSGYKPKVSKVEKKAAGKPLNDYPIKGYFFAFGGLQSRVVKLNKSWKLSGEPKGYSGFGVDNGDSPDKTQFQINAKGLRKISFRIEGESIPRFKVEINNNELQWIEGKKGEITLDLDPDLFPKGKLTKFQIIFESGKINCTISDIRAQGE